MITSLSMTSTVFAKRQTWICWTGVSLNVPTKVIMGTQFESCDKTASTMFDFMHDFALEIAMPILDRRREKLAKKVNGELTR